MNQKPRHPVFGLRVMKPGVPVCAAFDECQTRYSLDSLLVC